MMVPEVLLVADAPATVEVVVEQAPAAEEVIVVRHDLIYFCNCGGSCKCNHVSDEPGSCGCGMELKTS